MKILDGNVNALTNFEVLDFLRAKGASKDPTRVIAKVALSEYKVYDYLVNTPACCQTRESVNEFLTAIKQFEVSKAEMLNILNIRPALPVELFPIIENGRFPDDVTSEIVRLVKTILPAPPTEATSEEITEGGEEGNEISQDQTEGGEQMDTS